MSLNDGRLYGSIAVAKEIGISLRQLYYWVNVLQVVAPQAHPHGRRMFRRFTGSEVRRLQRMKRLASRGYTVRAAATRIKRCGNPP